MVIDRQGIQQNLSQRDQSLSTMMELMCLVSAGTIALTVSQQGNETSSLLKFSLIFLVINIFSTLVWFMGVTEKYHKILSHMLHHPDEYGKIDMPKFGQRAFSISLATFFIAYLLIVLQVL